MIERLRDAKGNFVGGWAVGTSNGIRTSVSAIGISAIIVALVDIDHVLVFAGLTRVFYLHSLFFALAMIALIHRVFGVL